MTHADEENILCSTPWPAVQISYDDHLLEGTKSTNLLGKNTIRQWQKILFLTVSIYLWAKKKAASGSHHAVYYGIPL